MDQCVNIGRTLLYNNVPQCVPVPVSVRFWTSASAAGPVFVRDWHFNDFAYFCQSLLFEMTFYRYVLARLPVYAYLFRLIPKTSNSIQWLWQELGVNINVQICIHRFHKYIDSSLLQIHQTKCNIRRGKCLDFYGLIRFLDPKNIHSGKHIHYHSLVALY